jgi:hypothetical protein
MEAVVLYIWRGEARARTIRQVSATAWDALFLHPLVGSGSLGEGIMTYVLGTERGWLKRPKADNLRSSTLSRGIVASHGSIRSFPTGKESDT